MAQANLFDTKAQAARYVETLRAQGKKATIKKFFSPQRIPYFLVIPARSNPTKRRTLSRVRKALTKYVRGAKNPTARDLPGTWVNAKARRLPNGKVQLKVNPNSLSGFGATQAHGKSVDAQIMRLASKRFPTPADARKLKSLVDRKQKMQARLASGR